jgi:hypothetical protein
VVAELDDAEYPLEPIELAKAEWHDLQAVSIATEVEERITGHRTAYEQGR